MNRGFIGLPVLIAIILGIVAVGGGAYFIVHQQQSSQTVSQSQNIVSDQNTNSATDIVIQKNSSNQKQDNTVAISAILDPISLKTSSTEPTISGTATGVEWVSISVSSGAGVNAKIIYRSGHIVPSNGHWAVTITPALLVGDYTIYVSTEGDLNGNTGTGDTGLLTTGTLSIMSQTSTQEVKTERYFPASSQNIVTVRSNDQARFEIYQNNILSISFTVRIPSNYVIDLTSAGYDLSDLNQQSRIFIKSPDFDESTSGIRGTAFAITYHPSGGIPLSQQNTTLGGEPAFTDEVTRLAGQSSYAEIHAIHNNIDFRIIFSTEDPFSYANKKVFSDFVNRFGFNL